MKKHPNYPKSIQIYFQELSRIIGDTQPDKIFQVAEVLFRAWKKGGTVFVIGCGGSASTASHFVCDLTKCTIVPGKKRFKAIALVDNTPLISAWTNDSGWETVFAEQLEPWLTEKDVLVGFSTRGGAVRGEVGLHSQNLGMAMELAKERKAKIIAFTGFDGGAMKKMADVCIVVPIDKEPFATPLIESFHVALHHLVCGILLKQMIVDSK